MLGWVNERGKVHSKSWNLPTDGLVCEGHATAKFGIDFFLITQTMDIHIMIPAKVEVAPTLPHVISYAPLSGRPYGV